MTIDNRLLRIVHIDTEKSWRGGQQQVVNLIEGLAQRGHQNILVLKKGSSLQEVCGRLGIPTYPIRTFGEWDIAAALQINNFLQYFKPHVVHAHSAHAVGLAALSSMGSDFPIIATRRVDFPLRKNPFSLWKHRRLKKIIAISNGVLRVLIQSGIPKEKIELVHSGVNFSRYEKVVAVSRTELGLDDQSIIVGQVAALADHKDQPTFLRALQLLRFKEPRVRGIIVGDGALRSEIEHLAQSIGVSDIVQFMGFQSDPLRILAAFDVFCLSSKEEGLGTSIIDAMALKIPVVATRVGGIPDLVEHDINGFLVNPQDPNEMASALLRMIHSDKKSLMREAAFQKAHEFDARITVEKMELVYASIVNDSLNPRVSI